jgi:hypothetical protein
MQRTIIKIMCLSIIALVVSGPIATSKMIAGKSNQINNNTRETPDAEEKIQEILDKINETLVRNFMEYLVVEIGLRNTGTDGCQEAAAYIHDQFETMGLQVRYHNWSAKIKNGDPNVLTSQNVEATHQGSDPTYDEILIFNAHYDTAKGTAGANDDASGTVAVLAAAYVLSQYSFKRTMRFVTFSGEEQGLFGSKAYARELYDQKTPILVEFNADGIGRASTAEYARKIRLTQTEDTDWMIALMQNMTKEYGLNFNITSFWEMNRGLPFGFSDYLYFIRLGYESICVWQADGDPNYHSPGDNISNINFSYLVNTTRHIAATMAILADTQVEVPQVYIANPRAGKIVHNNVVLKDIEYDASLVIDKINITAAVKQGKYPIEKVEFYYGKKLLFTDTEKPYEYMLNKRSVGVHRIKVMVYDTMGNSAVDQMNIWFVNLMRT